MGQGDQISPALRHCPSLAFCHATPLGDVGGVHDKSILLGSLGGMAGQPEGAEAASGVDTAQRHDGAGALLGPEHARLLAAAADHAAAAGLEHP